MKQSLRNFDVWSLAADPPFFLLCGLTLGGLILLALSGETESGGFSFDGRTLVVEGEALASLVSGPGTTAEYAPNERASLISANATFEQAGRLSAGVGYLLPRSFEEDVIGRRVEVELELRSLDREHGEALAAYFTAGSGDSRRHLVTLTTDWQTFSFSFDVPETAVANDQEWIGIWPDLEGLERPVLVRRITARILDDANN